MVELFLSLTSKSRLRVMGSSHNLDNIFFIVKYWVCDILGKKLTQWPAGIVTYWNTQCLDRLKITKNEEKRRNISVVYPLSFSWEKSACNWVARQFLSERKWRGRTSPNSLWEKMARWEKLACNSSAIQCNNQLLYDAISVSVYALTFDLWPLEQFVITWNIKTVACPERLVSFV